MKPVGFFHYLTTAIAVLAAATLFGCASPTSGKLNLAEQGYFFVGGKYVANKAGQQIRVNQMYVQYQIPAERKHPHPVVMWHGGGQTGTNFMGTPDGREGWGDYFLKQGYAVYIVDQPARARSGYFTEVYGRTRNPNTQGMSDRFTAPARANQWPQARLHTQWPGTGVAGDPIFDQFFSSQVEDIADVNAIEQLNREAGVALLDKIGPAIILTHSQSGPFGWVIANDRPKLVKGVIAIEPSGGPLHDVVMTPGAGAFYKDGAVARAWGVTRSPMNYQPAVTTAKELNLVRQATADAPNLIHCWLQPEPARQLPALKGIPILIVVSEASYHAPYDHCTAKYLTQAGVANQFVRLENIGIRGNGHMMMLEKNNLDIAAFLVKWSRENIR
jgi:pimeloyl-ACP methyl ester carboxylesterase